MTNACSLPERILVRLQCINDGKDKLMNNVNDASSFSAGTRWVIASLPLVVHKMLADFVASMIITFFIFLWYVSPLLIIAGIPFSLACLTILMLWSDLLRYLNIGQPFYEDIIDLSVSDNSRSSSFISTLEEDLSSSCSEINSEGIELSLSGSSSNQQSFLDSAYIYSDIEFSGSFKHLESGNEEMFMDIASDDDSLSENDKSSDTEEGSIEIVLVSESSEISN